MRLSVKQLAAMLAGSMLSPFLLMLPGDLAALSGGSGWMWPLIGALVPAVSVLIIACVPFKTSGNGKALSLLYSLFFLFASVILVRMQVELVALFLFKETPRWAIGAVLVLLGVWMAGAGTGKKQEDNNAGKQTGIAVAGRINELLLPVGVPALLILALAGAGGRATNLNVAAPSFAQINLIAPLLCYAFSGTAAMLYLRPRMPRRKQIKAGLGAVGWIAGIACLLTLAATAVLGPTLTAQMQFPGLTMLRVSVFALPSRLEIWLLLLFCLVAMQPVGNHALCFRLAAGEVFGQKTDRVWHWVWGAAALAGCLVIVDVNALRGLLPIAGWAGLAFGVAVPGVMLLWGLRAKS